MNLKPLDDRVIVEPDQKDDVSPGGIVLPDQAQDKPTRGKVLSVGPGKILPDGVTRAKMPVEEGDRVLHRVYGGTVVEFDGRDVVILNLEDILAVID